MINEWFTEFVRTNPAAQQPPPSPFPQSIPRAPQVLELIHMSKPPVDEIRKYGAEEFRATVDDDHERAEFWLENTTRVFDELSFDKAHKAEDFSKEKRRADSEARDSRKRLTAKATSVASVGSFKANKPECQQCGRRYFGECWMNDRACFRCGSQEHFIQDYLQLPEKDKLLTAQPSNIATRERPPRNTRDMSGSRGATYDSAIRSEAQVSARAYTIRAHEDASTPNIITRTFSLYNTDVTALIDLGSTYSYVCTNLVTSKSLTVESTEFVVKVSKPLGQYVLIDKNDETLRIESDNLSGLPVVVSTILAQKYVRKGCDAYLAYVLDTKVSEMKIDSVLVVSEYSDVFPKELPGLPPIRGVEFTIELVLGTSPISVAPYRMALTELKELRAQL
ncbi:uncharacterized protein LOC105789523 [Gossypium raimondii]|uniref:uncharacterized protein LOC105789523 n=1 Tax=Gossypium raimondii TaxID=29730 RepID=UPI00063A9ECC|nr:uncharacterized protein LOC105789523 [Gossypium raimondii]